MIIISLLDVKFALPLFVKLDIVLTPVLSSSDISFVNKSLLFTISEAIVEFVIFTLSSLAILFELFSVPSFIFELLIFTVPFLFWIAMILFDNIALFNVAVAFSLSNIIAVLAFWIVVLLITRLVSFSRLNPVKSVKSITLFSALLNPLIMNLPAPVTSISTVWYTVLSFAKL